MIIKILTINAWGGSPTLENLLKYLAAEDPDILLMQEVYSYPHSDIPRDFRTLEAVQERLHYPSSYFSAGFKHLLPNFEI